MLCILLPAEAPRHKPVAAPVTTTVHMHEEPVLDTAGDEAETHENHDAG